MGPKKAMKINILDIQRDALVESKTHALPTFSSGETAARDGDRADTGVWRPGGGMNRGRDRDDRMENSRSRGGNYGANEEVDDDMCWRDRPRIEPRGAREGPTERRERERGGGEDLGGFRGRSHIHQREDDLDFGSLRSRPSAGRDVARNVGDDDFASLRDRPAVNRPPESFRGGRAEPGSGRFADREDVNISEWRRSGAQDSSREDNRPQFLQKLRQKRLEKEGLSSVAEGGQQSLPVSAGPTSTSAVSSPPSSTKALSTSGGQDDQRTNSYRESLLQSRRTDMTTTTPGGSRTNTDSTNRLEEKMDKVSEPTTTPVPTKNRTYVPPSARNVVEKGLSSSPVLEPNRYPPPVSSLPSKSRQVDESPHVNKMAGSPPLPVSSDKPKGAYVPPHARSKPAVPSELNPGTTTSEVIAVNEPLNGTEEKKVEKKVDERKSQYRRKMEEKEKERREQEERSRLEKETILREEKDKMRNIDSDYLSVLRRLEAELNSVVSTSNPVAFDQERILSCFPDGLSSVFPTVIVAKVILRDAYEHAETYDDVRRRVQIFKPLLIHLIGSSGISHHKFLFLLETTRIANALGVPMLTSEWGLLESFWDALYFEEIIDEETFQSWFDYTEDSTAGRSEVLFQVGRWFDWLNNAAYINDDDEGSDESDEDFDIEAAIPKRSVLFK